jgi:hypothetical protein
VRQAPHLVGLDVAHQIVRFVATAKGDQPLSDLEVEPSLLSVVCRELNESRKAAGAPTITAALLEGSREQVLAEFYERSMADVAPAVRRFVEDDLLTLSGYRDNVALENALNTPGVTREAIDVLVARRLVRREERGGVERLELTHDLLCGVVRASRDRRRQAEAAEEQRRKERLALEESAERERQERHRRDLKRTRIAAVVFLLLTVVAVGAATAALNLRSAAEKERSVAQSASVTADEQRKRAEQALDTIQRSLLIRQAALSNDTESLDKLLSSLDRSTQLRFRSTASNLGYKNTAGQQVYKFELFPDPRSVPKGDDGVAFVTYLADHPTFHNTLMTSGPNRDFRASYIGWGCLSRIVALVEYRNPSKPPTVSEFNMCELLGW